MVGAFIITILNLVIGTASHWQRRLGLTIVCAFNPHFYYKSKDKKHLKVIINTEEGYRGLK